MNRKIKALGLALVAAFAMSAVIASAASAAQVHSGASGTTYIGGVQSGTNQLDLENGANVKCTVVEYKGSYGGTTSSTVTVTPTYKTCTSSGQATTIDTTGCDLTLDTPTGSGDSYSGTATIGCEAGKAIKIAVGDPTVTCTVTIGAQTPTGTVDYEDNTSGTANQDDITLTSTVTGVVYTSTGSVCGPSGKGNLTGKVTAKGYQDSALTEQRDLWIA